MMSNWETYVAETTYRNYHETGVPCGVTTVSMLAEIFGVELQPQVLDAAIGVIGAGKYGAQCGILEGGILFMGIYAKIKGIGKKDVWALIRGMTELFEKEIGGLNCRDLRPYPFTPEDAPKHLCEPITVKGVTLIAGFIAENM